MILLITRQIFSIALYIVFLLPLLGQNIFVTGGWSKAEIIKQINFTNTCQTITHNTGSEICAVTDR